MITPMTSAPIRPTSTKPAPSARPSPTAQNMNTVSIGSLIAVRKRTMDSAPTMPSDSVRFEEISISTSDETIVRRMRLMLKERE